MSTRVPIFLLILGALGCGVGCAPSHISYQIEPSYTVGDAEFRQTLGNLLGPPIVGGNRATTLVNGKQIFPAMLDAIRSAKHTITFETYIYWSSDVAQRFTDALCDRARNGVKVHLIIDAVGSDKINRANLRQLHDAGAHLVVYHPLHFWDVTTTQKLNHRTHRKLLVIDGHIGFTGGVGIADEWAGDADSPEHWRDSHYRVEGPVVAQLQAAFMDNWMKCTGQVLHGEEYFPTDLTDVKSDSGVGAWAQVFKSSATGGSESMQLLYLLSLAAAKESVLIESSYFVPDDLTVDALLAARGRGVRIAIIVPGKHIDEKIVRAASRARWGKLLEADVEIYEYQPTMIHCKLMSAMGHDRLIESRRPILSPQRRGEPQRARHHVRRRAGANLRIRSRALEASHPRRLEASPVPRTARRGLCVAVRMVDVDAGALRSSRGDPRDLPSPTRMPDPSRVRSG